MDRYYPSNPPESERIVYDMDRLGIRNRSSSPLPAPLDLSCHNRHRSPKDTDYDQETPYDYSLKGVSQSSHSHGLQESVVQSSQQLDYSQYPSESSHHGLYPCDPEVAYRISSTYSPPTMSSDLYNHHEYHQYRVESSISPYSYEESLLTHSPSHSRSPRLTISPADDNSYASGEILDSEHSVLGMNYHPLTVSTSHVSRAGYETYLSPRDSYERISPRGLVSPTGSQYSNYGTYAGSTLHVPQEMVGASGYESQYSSSESCVSPELALKYIPESLAKFPRGKARRQNIDHSYLTEEEKLHRKREINNDSSRRHRQRKNLSIKQLEDEEQKQIAKQIQLTKKRDMLKQQTELLSSLLERRKV